MNTPFNLKAICLGVIGMATANSHAAATIVIEQDGPNVTISSTGGTVDLTGLSIVNTGATANTLYVGELQLYGVQDGADLAVALNSGNLTPSPGWTEGTVGVPVTFTLGSEEILFGSLGGFGGNDDRILFDRSWIAGVNNLGAFSATTDVPTDLATLGLTPGTSLTWNGATGDTVTIEIPGVVPEPASALLMWLGLSVFFRTSSSSLAVHLLKWRGGL